VHHFVTAEDNTVSSCTPCIQQWPWKQMLEPSPPRCFPVAFRCAAQPYEWQTLRHTTEVFYVNVKTVKYVSSTLQKSTWTNERRYPTAAQKRIAQIETYNKMNNWLTTTHVSYNIRFFLNLLTKAAAQQTHRHKAKIPACRSLIYSRKAEISVWKFRKKLCYKQCVWELRVWVPHAVRAQGWEG